MGMFSEIKRLTQPYDDDDDYEYSYKPTPAKNAAQRSAGLKQGEYGQTKVYNAESDADTEAARDEKSDRVLNIHTTTQLQVVLSKPESFEDATEIADHLKAKRTVLLNLEGVSKDLARRLLDFVSGVAYANEGKIKKVSVNTYIITPYNVAVIGDLIDEIEHSVRFM